jgi:hypothetical protein
VKRKQENERAKAKRKKLRKEHVEDEEQEATVADEEEKRTMLMTMWRTRRMRSTRHRHRLCRHRHHCQCRQRAVPSCDQHDDYGTQARIVTALQYTDDSVKACLGATATVTTIVEFCRLIGPCFYPGPDAHESARGTGHANRAGRMAPSQRVAVPREATHFRSRRGRMHDG